LTSANRERIVWLETTEMTCLTTAIELGLTNTVVVTHASDVVNGFRRAAANVEVLTVDGSSGRVSDGSGRNRGVVVRVDSPEACARAGALADDETVGGAVVMDAASGGWSVIPAENLVAAFGGGQRRNALFARCGDAESARVMLEALETGVDGVVLASDDPMEVRAMSEVMKEHFSGDDGANDVELVEATLTAIKRVGAGDRVAVDACVNFAPGEGLLVGSFASGLFLVHAENVECGYVNTRPFRVNAGPTASYCQAPDGKTAYLSELRAGSEVLACDYRGKTRVINVARAKIERRSMVLIEAERAGARFACVLQNAETCRLVRPDGAPLSIAEMSPGDVVLVAVNDVARHTGVAVDEEAWLER
jgi:3-dehydroquinate synthase II